MAWTHFKNDNRDFQKYYYIINQEDIEISEDP
jgi:hypothetical protein